jgi:tRNA threonylcarbamoyladenosine biosynthesis protein TsaB
MSILAFDTCFDACSVAVRTAGQGRMLAERFEAMDKGHSERIVPMIAEVLTEAGLTLAQVATLAVTIGPGSFTGVRTGLAVARGLALATGVEIRGTASLHVMAAGLIEATGHEKVAIAVATRDGLVYFQAFDRASADPVAAPCLATPHQAAPLLGQRCHVVAGSGAGLVVAAAAVQGHAHHDFGAQIHVKAGVLAGMAARLPILDPPKPLYLREPDAKPQTGPAIMQAATRT